MSGLSDLILLLVGGFYKMTKEEHTATMEKLRTLITSETVDFPQIETIFTSLGEDNDKQNGSIADFTQKNTKLNENNVKLQGFNMEMFTRVGEQQTKSADGIITKPEEPQKLEFTSLFNDEGELI